MAEFCLEAGQVVPGSGHCSVREHAVRSQLLRAGDDGGQGDVVAAQDEPVGCDQRKIREFQGGGHAPRQVGDAVGDRRDPDRRGDADRSSSAHEPQADAAGGLW